MVKSTVIAIIFFGLGDILFVGLLLPCFRNLIYETYIRIEKYVVVS